MFQDKLDDTAYKILMDYHSATVTLLALISAATDDVSNSFMEQHSIRFLMLVLALFKFVFSVWNFLVMRISCYMAAWFAVVHLF